MQDRRIENRFFCADLVEVSWQQAGREVHHVANLEDISQTGVCLLMEMPIEAGTEVTVRCGADSLTGVVRHCTARLEEWTLGIELHVFSQWSADAYKPEHLLDPNDMFPQTINS